MPVFVNIILNSTKLPYQNKNRTVDILQGCSIICLVVKNSFKQTFKENIMAIPTVLNNQYKSDKEAGRTAATNYAGWHKEFLARSIEVVTSEMIEQQIANIQLSDDQIQSIVTTLAEPVTSVVTLPISKAAHARLIYDEMDAISITTKVALIRKNIIDRFVAELPISKVGAATYLQNIKTKKGLVNHK